MCGFGNRARRLLYGLEETRIDKPADCSGVRFGAPRQIPEFEDPPAELDAQLSADGNELWFIVYVDGPPRMFRTTRPDPGSAFAPAVEPALVDYPNFIDPSLSADGRRLMFIASGDGMHEVFEGVRADASSATFDSFRIVAGVVPPTGQFANGVESLDLSWDGLRLYYTSDDTLYTARRKGRDEPFIEQAIVMTGVSFFTLSGDELEIFYNREGQATRLFRRTRPDPASPFGVEEFALDDGGDPDISARSNTLIVGRNNGLAILERECP